MHLKRLSSRPCSPEGLFQKNVTPSWLGLFSACVLLAFLHVEHHNANTLRRSCKNRELAFPLALFCHTHSASVPHWLYGCSLLDVSPLLNIPRSPLPPPSLPSSLSLPAIFCSMRLHARPASPWLLTSKRHFIHQSLIRKRGPFSGALKEREGTRREFIKREGTSVWKEDMREKEDLLLTARNLQPQKQNRGRSYGCTLVAELLSFFHFFLGVFRFRTHNPFPIFPILLSFCLSFPSFLSLEPSVQRGVEACSFS